MNNDKKMSMNGWQRLWAVASLILAILIGWYTFLILPTNARLTYYHESRVEQLTGYLRSAINSDYSNEFIDSLRESIRKENEDFPKELAEAPKKRREFVTTGLGLWAGLVWGCTSLGG